jgi:hypothetical protein
MIDSKTKAILINDGTSSPFLVGLIRCKLHIDSLIKMESSLLKLSKGGNRHATLALQSEIPVTVSDSDGKDISMTLNEWKDSYNQDAYGFDWEEQMNKSVKLL